MKIYILLLALVLSCSANSDLEKVNVLLSDTNKMISQVDDMKKKYYKNIRDDILNEIDTYGEDIRFVEGGRLFKKLKKNAQKYALYAGLDVNRLNGLYSMMNNTIKNTDYGSDSVCENNMNQFIPEFFKVCDKNKKRRFDDRHRDAQHDKAALAYLKSLIEPDPAKGLINLEKYTDSIRLIAFGANDKLIAEAEMIQAEQRLTVDVVSGIPIVGDVLDLYAIVTGEDAAGMQLSAAERTISSVFMLGPDLYKLSKQPFVKKALGKSKVFFEALSSSTAVQKLADSTGMSYKKIEQARDSYLKFMKKIPKDEKLLVKGADKLKDTKNLGKKFIPNETDPGFSKWLDDLNTKENPLLNAKELAQDAKWRKGFKKAQQRVDNFEILQKKLALDPNNKILQKQMMSRVIELNKDFGFKALMKTTADGSKRIDALSTAFDSTIQKFYKEVDLKFAEDMRAQGFKNFNVDSIQDFRNASSKNTVGMDRDKGLLSIFSIPQNKSLEKARQNLIKTNTRILADGTTAVIPMSEWSKGTKKSYEYLIEKMKGKYKGWIDPQLIHNGKHISERTWNDSAQKVYEKAYGEIAGTLLSKKALKRIDLKKLSHNSLQEITSRANIEAYLDPGALNNFSDLSKKFLEHSVDVTRYKTSNAIAQLGEVFGSHEAARGFIKDFSKVKRALTQAARKSGKNIFKLKPNHNAAIELMKRIETRSISPAQANAIMRRISGKNLKTIREEILSNYGAVKLFM